MHQLSIKEGTETESFSPWISPLFRWAGSKRKLLPHLIKYVPRKYDRYIEPFAGSACLFFALKPRTAVLGDINEELLTTYEVIRSHPRLVARMASSYSNSEEQYYFLRSQPPENFNPIERAARFIYLNRYCFNGIYRTNKKGEFNVPRGSHTGKIQSEDFFYRCSIALRGTEFRSFDFMECLSDVKQGDFVYLDPPYATSGKRRYGEYGNNSFAKDDLQRLIACLEFIDKSGAIFLLSYADCPDLKSLLPPKWNCESLSVKRHVAGFVKFRAHVTEILVTNR